ncbi:MAG: YqgE/AlgH family protein [Proteobacteria bacterium]|nr:YqgE/AlgH family protein [Pseudomonadota bacterium]
MENRYYKGQLLVAMPNLADPFFSRSVTCLCEHKEEGAFGIVINQTYTDITEKDFFKSLDIECKKEPCDRLIHIGGPVQKFNVFVLHGQPFHWLNCFMVSDTIAMSSTIDILQAVADGSGPENYLIATGCAGWAPGQLEVEMKRNSWITCPLDDQLIFNIPTDEKWEASIRTLGIDPAFIMDGAGHA